MIEWLGLLYGLAKDLKDYVQWNEEEKLVDMGWPEKSGFQAQAERNSLKLSWSTAEKVQSRLLDGYEVMYEIDKVKRVRRKIVLKDGMILLGKRS